MIVRLKFERQNENVIEFSDGKASTLVHVLDPDTNELLKVGTLRMIATWLEAEGFDYVAGTNGLWSTNPEVRETNARVAQERAAESIARGLRGMPA